MTIFLYLNENYEDIKNNGYTGDILAYTYGQQY